MKKRLLIVLILLFTLLSHGTELKRSGWNLIAVCQDMNASDVNMTNISEIQNQNGKSIYTGEFEEFSNLEKLEAGYAYWVKGEAGNSFFSGEALSSLEKPLLREEWNLMASCEDMKRDDLNMSSLVEIQSQDGKSIYTGEFEKFSNLELLENGYGYWVKGELGTLFSSKRKTNISSKYHDILGMSLKFYEAQRAIGPFPTVKWRKPASTHDGDDVGVDLNGGWFDAGDHVKFNQPMSYTVTMLNWSIIKNRDVYASLGKLAYGKDQVKYALDYLLKTYNTGNDLNSASDDKVYYQVEDGNADHSAGWIAPHQITKDRPTFTCDKESKCSAISAQMSAAFASGSILFADDKAYSSTLLENAKRIFKFAETYQGDAGSNAKASPFYTSGGFKDELGLASMWLYKATGDSAYLEKAKAYVEEGGDPINWVLSWENVNFETLLLLLEETGESVHAQKLEQHVDYWLNGINKTPAGYRHLSQWGSMRYTANTAFVALAYSELLDDGAKKTSYIEFAKSQIDYMLGDNPTNFSFVVGYGDHYPTKVHHRGATGFNDEHSSQDNLYPIEGALIGGFKSADDYDYQKNGDNRSDYYRNEVAVDYNAGFTGALAKLALLYGKDVNASDNNNSNNGDDNSTTTPTDAELVATAKKALTFDTIKNANLSEASIKTNLSLITLGKGGVTIQWSSSSSAITPQGVVTRDSKSVQVTLTATLSKGTVSDTKQFTLVVLKEELNAGECQVTYGVRDSWDAGFVVDFSIVNHQGNLYGWNVTFTLPTGQRITDIWNGDKSASEGFIKVTNKDYNAQVDDGAKAEFRFVVNHSGQDGIPTDIRFNGKLCDGQIGGIEKPTAPSDLSSQLINNTKAILSWVDKSDNEDNFLVLKSIDLNSWQIITTLDENSTTYTDEGLETGRSYRYKIQAQNIAGESSSNIITITPSTINIEDGVDNSAVSIVSNCAACHTESNSDSAIPVIHGLDKEYLVKTLKGYRSKKHFGYVMDRIMDGYSDVEIEMMAEYYSSREWIGNRIVSYDIDKINSGKQLFDSNCKACHGSDGKGAVAKVNISSQSKGYLVDTMIQYTKGLHSDANTDMSNIFVNTIGEDSTKIEALATYLAVGLNVPIGDNDTIRGFNAKYLNSSKKIEAYWDYINPDTQSIEAMVNGVVVKRTTDINSSSIIIDNDGSSDFVIDRSYNISIRTINGDKNTTSQEIPVKIMSAVAYGEEYYNSQCKVCHGVNGTHKKDITKWNSADHTFAQFTQNSAMPEGYYSGCDGECLDLIGLYVTNVLVPRVRDNNTSDVKDVYSDIPRGYRLLNAVEYTNTLYSLLEIDNDSHRAETIGFSYTALPKDNIVDGYNTDRDMNRIDEYKVKYLNKKAHEIEVYLESLKGQSGLSCQIGGYNFCTADINTFLDTYATKIFRRPLTNSEKTTYRGLKSVSEIVGDMLVSPHFLYRSEMGVETNETNVYQLTQYEIATAISYAMAGTTPDDELLELAKNNQLLEANTRVVQAVRLSHLQTGKDKLDDFIGRWLLGDNIYTLTDKNPEKFPGYTLEVRDSQSEQILKFFRMVMDSPTHSSYRDLFINENIVTNRVISNYYGEGTSNSDSFEKVPATTTRYGLLTLGAVASKYANSEEAHPFQRGKFVLSRLMCHPLGIPGNGGDVPAIRDHRGENKRDRYSEHVNDPSCAACHALIDPIGFTWEKYDGTGRYRTHEYHPEEYGGPKPIDTAVTLKGLLTFDAADENSANGISDVSSLIADSDRGPECMAFQYYRYIFGDTHADIENSRVVRKISSDFKDENYDLQGLFTNIVGLKSFITRKGI